MIMYNLLNRVYDYLYKEPFYYIYSRSFYHVLIIIFTLLHISDIQPNVFFVLNFDTFNLHLFESGIESLIKNVIFVLLIMIVDVIFLLILMYEFKSLKLTYTKIFFLEIIIFVLALSNPTLRMIMLFLSLNTLEVTVFYKIIKYIPFSKYAFLTGSYILILKLLLVPVIEFYNYVML